jgi:hypothetical protein
MEDSPIDFTCDTCGKALKVKAKGAGRTITCPWCKQPTVVPTIEMGLPDDDPFGFEALAKLDEVTRAQPTPPTPTPPTPPQPNPYSTPAVDASPQRQDLPWETALPAKRSYPALWFIAKLYRIVAYIIAGLALIGFALGLIVSVVMLVRTGSPMGVLPFVATTIPATIGALLTAVFLVMFSELIQLAVNIQENTLATAHASRRAAG